MLRWCLLVVSLVSASHVQAQNLSLVASRNLAGDVSRVLGAGEMAGALKSGGAPTLLVDLGGALSPSENAFEHRRQGSLTVDLMNRAGYAAWFLGERDLAWQNQLTRFLRRTDFPVLAANLHRPETGRHLFQVQPYTILRVARMRLGLIGLAQASDGVLASDPVEAARYYGGLIAPRTDLTIVVSASGLEVDAQIAAIDEIDLVVGAGRSSGVRQVEGGWVVTVTEFDGLWGIDLGVEDGRITSAVANTMQIPAVDPSKIREAFVGWTATVEGEPVSLGTVIGRSEGGFQRAVTSPLGYLVSDLVMASGGTDGALVHATHFPDDFATGDVTVYDLFRAYPLPYTVGVASIKGRDLLDLLDLDGGDLTYYPSGIQAVYGEIDGQGKLLEAAISAKPIDPRIDYTVAVEYGAASDPRLSTQSVRDTGVLIRDLVGRHLRTTEAVKGIVDGRIQRR